MAISRGVAKDPKALLILKGEKQSITDQMLRNHRERGGSSIRIGVDPSIITDSTNASRLIANLACWTFPSLVAAEGAAPEVDINKTTRQHYEWRQSYKRTAHRFEDITQLTPVCLSLNER